MQLNYYIEIHVAGHGQFPFDMLRFAQMFPVDGESAGKLQRDPMLKPLEDKREIKLGMYAYSKTQADHVCDRFASFLWGAKIWECTRL